MGVGGLSHLGFLQGFGLSQLQSHQQTIERSLERLSTGKRINRASDDPSGLIATDSLKVQRYTLEKRLEGFERETGWLGAREGAVSVIDDMLTELQGFVVQASNDAGMTDAERDGIVEEVKSILLGIDHIANSSSFGGERLLSGFNTNELGIQPVGSEQHKDGTTTETPQRSLADLARLIVDDPELAQKIAKEAKSAVTGQRAAIGNRMKSIESQKKALAVEFEELSGAISMIEDADIAKETAELIRSQILEQATMAAIQIGREQAAHVLDLLTPASKLI